MSRSTKHFVRHYVEMVVAMFAGMAVLGFPADRAMDAMGATLGRVHVPRHGDDDDRRRWSRG